MTITVQSKTVRGRFFLESGQMVTVWVPAGEYTVGEAPSRDGRAVSVLNRVGGTESSTYLVDQSQLSPTEEVASK